MKHLLKILAMVLFAVATWGCSEEEVVTISLSMEALDFSSSGSSKTVSVQCSEEWKAETSATWCTVRKDQNNLKVTVSTNFSDKSRSAEIVVSAANVSKNIVVNQAAGSGVFKVLSVTSDDVEISPVEGDDISVSAVEKVYKFKVALSNGSYSWSMTPVLSDGQEKFFDCDAISSHKGNGEFEFEVKDNSTHQQRKVTLKIVCEIDGVKDEYILNISQRAAEVVSKSFPTMRDEYGGEYDLAVEVFPSDAEVALAVGSEWLHKGEGMGDDDICGKIKVDDNLTIENRVGKIYVVSLPDGEKIDSVMIPQRAGLTIPITMDCNSYVTDYEDPDGRKAKGCPPCADYILTGTSVDQSEKLDKWGGMLNETCWRKKYVEEQRAQLSFFFYTKRTGNLNMAIRGLMSGKTTSATVRVTCNGKSYDVEIAGGKLHDTPVGVFYVDKPQWVRVDIRGIKTSMSYYPYITDLVFGGDAVGYATQKCDDVWFVNHQDAMNDNPHWIRRGPAVHQGWHMPKGPDGKNLTVEYFYNEVLVPEGDDINGSYYMTTGGDGFYMGIQPGAPDKNNKHASVLFSVWHNEARRKRTRIERYSKDIPGKTFDGLRDTTYHVVLTTYDHEGSGTGTRLHYPWKTGETMATLCQVRPEVNADGKLTGNSIYAGYFWTKNTGWILMAEIRRPAMQVYYTAPYSFNENFSPHNGYITRSVEFPRQYFITPDGEWHECLGFHQGGGRQVDAGLEGRNDCSSGLRENGHFYGQIGGYYNDNTMPLGHVYREPSKEPRPEIDFEALSQLGEKIDWVNKTNIPAGFENWKEDY